MARPSPELAATQNVVEADEEPPSRLPLYLILGGIGADRRGRPGLWLGNVVSGKADSNGSRAITRWPKRMSRPTRTSSSRRRLPTLRPCRPKEQLAKAFEAAFGSAGSATVNAPAGRGRRGERGPLPPGRLIQAPFGPVLVSEGEIKDAPHVSGGPDRNHLICAAKATISPLRGASPRRW
jgi:hypothetical protein